MGLELYEKSKNLTVLFVEDYLPLQKVISSILNDYFKHVSVASNGQEGLQEYVDFEKKTQKAYDIVITDYEMPKLNGIELMKEIKNQNQNQIFIVISAHQDPQNLIEFINLGIKYFASKPIGTQNLIELFDKVSDNFVSEDKNIFHIDDSLIWHKKERSLFYKDKSVNLAKYDALLLDILLENFNVNCPIDNILSHFYIHNEDIKQSNIRNMVARLRKKIPNINIENIYDVGYKLSVGGK